MLPSEDKKGAYSAKKPSPLLFKEILFQLELLYIHKSTTDSSASPDMEETITTAPTTGSDTPMAGSSALIPLVPTPRCLAQLQAILQKLSHLDQLDSYFNSQIEALKPAVSRPGPLGTEQDT